MRISKNQPRSTGGGDHLFSRSRRVRARGETFVGRAPHSCAYRYELDPQVRPVSFLSRSINGLLSRHPVFAQMRASVVLVEHALAGSGATQHVLAQLLFVGRGHRRSILFWSNGFAARSGSHGFIFPAGPPWLRFRSSVATRVSDRALLIMRLRAASFQMPVIFQKFDRCPGLCYPLPGTQHFRPHHSNNQPARLMRDRRFSSRR